VRNARTLLASSTSMQQTKVLSYTYTANISLGNAKYAHQWDGSRGLQESYTYIVASPYPYIVDFSTKNTGSISINLCVTHHKPQCCRKWAPITGHGEPEQINMVYQVT
jgi:hypothetical protein